MPAFQPYRGKPAVRNVRGDRGNVGIIQSPVRASILPDQHVNSSVFRRLLLSDEGVDNTLDIDATQIVAEKREAHYTYKGEKGYMPMVGHIAELSLVAGHEFREGNTAPAARNLEFMKACERKMPKEKRIAAVRADSAAYQAGIFNWCEETGKL